MRYIETRDCDDELGSNGFLRQAVGQLEHDERLAYVQTIKEAQVSAGDPFNNREAMFYRGQMLSRNAANATFPCGSGLVWRRAALEDIGLFPTWNLVEDLQSGIEALRRGWDSCYLPIVGAVGQHSPEDVPNVYKQRGTWAIDTVRLMIWGDLRGLRLRQRMQFAELLCYYLHAFTVLIYIPCIVFALLGYVPFRSDRGELRGARRPAGAGDGGVADGDQPPLQRPPAPPAPPDPRTVAGADHLERPGAGVHQGLDPGDPRRPEPQAGLQGDAQVHRPALALEPDAAADRGADARALHAYLRAAQRHAAAPDRATAVRLLGRAVRRAVRGLRGTQLVRRKQPTHDAACTDQRQRAGAPARRAPRCPNTAEPEPRATPATPGTRRCVPGGAPARWR